MTMYAICLKKSLMVTLAIALSACATSEKEKETGPASISPAAETEMIPPPPPESRAAQVSDQVDTSNTTLTAVERRFSEGLALYNDGRYADAIKIFREPVFTRAWPELRMRSLKYLAFSYCVTEKAQQCQQSFEEVFKLDASFELSSAERGHPLWDPVFQQAKTKATSSSR